MQTIPVRRVGDLRPVGTVLIAFFLVAFGLRLAWLGYKDLDAELLPILFGYGFLVVGILAFGRGLVILLGLIRGHEAPRTGGSLLVQRMLHGFLYFWVLYMTPHWLPWYWVLTE